MHLHVSHESESAANSCKLAFKARHTSEALDRRASLLDLGEDRSGTPGGGHAEYERVERRECFGVGRWRRLRILLAVGGRRLRADNGR